jgi:hypothetical protein
VFEKIFLKVVDLVPKVLKLLLFDSKLLFEEGDLGKLGLEVLGKRGEDADLGL